MRERSLLAGLLALPLVALACSGVGGLSDDAGPVDATTDVPKIGDPRPDTGADAPEATDAPVDVAPDVVDEPTEDAGGPDVVIVDAAPDVPEYEGGNVCPGVGLCMGACQCDAGYMNQWHVMDPDTLVDYLCGYGAAPTNPQCPKGWQCSGYKGATFVTETCP
jgi:hypothetical protein